MSLYPEERLKATREDKIIFLCSVPLLALALVASAAGQAIRDLPRDIRDHWDNLNRRGYR